MDYTATFRYDRMVHGRILMGRLVRSFRRLPSLPQQCRLRTFDTNHNIVLALALDKVPVMLTEATELDKQKLAHLRDVWAGIQRAVEDPVSVVTEVQWACPPGYRSALQLARMILIGAAIAQASDAGGQGFSLSLASLWEQSVRQMVDQLTEETGWHPVADAERHCPWADAAGPLDPNRWMTADAMAERGNRRWVLDAKYKRAFGIESRNDRFQMCGYALAFNADRATLVYPTGQRESSRRVLLTTVAGGKSIEIDSVELPMADGPEKCRRGLQQMAVALPTCADSVAQAQPRALIYKRLQ